MSKRAVGVALLFLVVMWAGTLGISFAVVEWRDDEPTTLEVEPSSTPSIDAAQCQAAVALFAAIDRVLERATDPSDNLVDEWERSAQNMDARCFMGTPTPEPTE